MSTLKQNLRLIYCQPIVISSWFWNSFLFNYLISFSAYKARQESRSKDEALKTFEESLQNEQSKAKGKDQIYKNQLNKIKELEGQLELKTSLHGQSEKQISLLSERLKGKEETCERLQQKVPYLR